MRLSQVDLNLFTVFDAIYREGGITPASKRLHLSQSAVSHSLARLRTLLNDPLFERAGNEMLPTPRAKLLALTVTQSLENIEQLLHGAAQFDPAQSHRSFSIAMRDSHEAKFLPRVIDYLRRCGPDIDIATVRASRRDLQNDLQTGELDAAIDVLLPLPNAVKRQAIGSEPLVVLARRNHPIVNNAIDLATYLSLEHVLVTSRRHGGGLEDVALRELGLQRRVKIRCQQHFAANEAVAHSDLLATMPHSYAMQINRHTDNQLLPFPAAGQTLELFLYWHANVDEDPANRWLRQTIVSMLHN